MFTNVQYAGNIPPGERFAYDPQMAATTVGETSQKMLCLGFVIQREDHAQGVDARIKKRFASERFTRGAALKSLPTLAAEGLLELVREGAERPLDRYRATPDGEEKFFEWLRRTELPPTVRDWLQCKLEFFEIEELPEVIEDIGQQQEAFSAATNIAHERLQDEKRIRRERTRDDKPTSWRLEFRIAKAKDAVRLGNLMVERLKHLRGDLEELLARYRAEVGDG